MNKTKRIFLIVAMVTALVLCFAFGASAATQVANGTCGDNISWTLDDEGTLTITGSGALSTSLSMPWSSYQNDIKSVTIADGITSIGNYAFYRCTNLESVTIPDSVESTGYCSFAHCTSLTSITISENLTGISISSFAYCTSLESITVDEDNTDYSSDEYGVLFNKDKTELIQYPAGNSSTSYTIPDSVIGIYDNAFYGCTSLENITIPDSVENICSGAFRECTSLESVTIGNSVRSIPSEAFYNCTSLKSVTIPDSVTSIGEWAFHNCTSLERITFHDSVARIDWGAFTFCTSLTDVCYKGTEESWNEINVGHDNTDLTDAEIHYNSTYALTGTVAPTCTEKGLLTYTCPCGDSYTEEIEALGHSYTSDTTPATTFGDGVVTYTCSCGDSYEEIIPQLTCEICNSIHTTMVEEYICIIVRFFKLVESFITSIG